MARKFIDLSGLRFGRWIVISHAGMSQRGVSFWNCICDCGEKKIVCGGNLKNGHTNSCGCFRREHTRKQFMTHGQSGTKIWVVWKEMIQRCHNVNHKSYHNYGGRGIKVCKRWLKSPVFFLKDMRHPPSDLTLERIYNNKGYF